MLKSTIAAVVLATPFAVASIRSLLKQPLAECSSSSRADSVVVLSSSCVLVIMGLTYLLTFFHGNFFISRMNGFILNLVFFCGWAFFVYCHILPVVLGIWASVEPERQVLVHSLLIIVPPIFTSAVVFMRYKVFPKNYPRLEENEAGVEAF